MHYEDPYAGDIYKGKLTHLSLASLLWDIGKQNSPRCDAAERGVPSGAILFHTCDISRSRRVFPILGFLTRLSPDEPSRAQISRFQYLPIPIFRQCSIFNFAVIYGTC